MLTRAQPVASAAAQRVVVADAAGQLDGHVEAAHHLGEQGAVLAATERRVEVDQVDPLGAGLLPGQGRSQRFAVRRLAARLALYQANRLAARDVHGGKQHEVVGGEGHGRVLRSRVRVTSTGSASSPTRAAAPRTHQSGQMSQTIDCTARYMMTMMPF